jgi:hypothetical protein
MTAHLTRPIEWLIHLLIPGWIDDDSPTDWRLRLICWAWGREDRRVNPDSYRETP